MSEDTLDIVQMHAMYDDIKVYERLHSATVQAEVFLSCSKDLEQAQTDFDIELSKAAKLLDQLKGTALRDYESKVTRVLAAHDKALPFLDEVKKCMQDVENAMPKLHTLLRDRSQVEGVAHSAFQLHKVIEATQKVTQSDAIAAFKDLCKKAVKISVLRHEDMKKMMGVTARALGDLENSDAELASSSTCKTIGPFLRGVILTMSSVMRNSKRKLNEYERFKDMLCSMPRTLQIMETEGMHSSCTICRESGIHANCSECETSVCADCYGQYVAS